MENDVLKYVALSIIPGIGTISQNRLLRMCRGINECFDKSLEELILLDGKYSIGSMGKRKAEEFCIGRTDPKIMENAARIVESCKSEGIDIITSDDPIYPKRLEGLSDSPIVLYSKGTLTVNEYPRSVGIIGARRCSDEGKDKAIELTADEVRRQSAIISGMAKGIDSYAHTAAIKSEGYTVAVLGNGPNICYPKEHQKLYDSIINKGCVLSEYPPGIHPSKYNFPKRNRIIAALSDEVFVVGAGRISGTNTTVEYCRKYNRPVVLFRVL